MFIHLFICLSFGSCRLSSILRYGTGVFMQPTEYKCCAHMSCALYFICSYFRGFYLFLCVRFEQCRYSLIRVLRSRCIRAYYSMYSFYLLIFGLNYCFFFRFWVMSALFDSFVITWPKWNIQMSRTITSGHFRCLLSLQREVRDS